MAVLWRVLCFGWASRASVPGLLGPGCLSCAGLKPAPLIVVVVLPLVSSRLARSGRRAGLGGKGHLVLKWLLVED